MVGWFHPDYHPILFSPFRLNGCRVSCQNLISPRRPFTKKKTKQKTFDSNCLIINLTIISRDFDAQMKIQISNTPCVAPNNIIRYYTVYMEISLSTNPSSSSSESYFIYKFRVVVVVYLGERVLACGTNAFSPRCSWRPVEAIDVVSEWSSGVAR